MQCGLGLISGVDVHHLLAGHAASSMVHHCINAAISAAKKGQALLITASAIAPRRTNTACNQYGAAWKQWSQPCHVLAPLQLHVPKARQAKCVKQTQDPELAIAASLRTPSMTKGALPKNQLNSWLCQNMSATMLSTLPHIQAHHTSHNAAHFRTWPELCQQWPPSMAAELLAVHAEAVAPLAWGLWTAADTDLASPPRFLPCCLFVCF